MSVAPMTTPHRRFKDSMYEQVARVAKALSAPKRLELLDLLGQGPRTVEALANQAELSIANASQHLKILRGANLVEAQKLGSYVEYRLSDEGVGRFTVGLRELAESRLAEVERLSRDYWQSRGALEPVDSEELVRRVRRGDVTLVDVRPPEEFRAGHLPGALSIPVADLRARLAELPPGRQVVAYCRGPYCAMAVEAVEVLRRKGFEAHRLELGVLEWRARGLRVAAER